MTIFKKNNLNIGIGLGLILPMILFAVFLGLLQIGLPLKVRTVALIGICANALVINVFRKNRAGESVRGVAFATVTLAIVWGINFYQEISAEWNG
jgi:hypothetical protein